MVLYFPVSHVHPQFFCGILLLINVRKLFSNMVKYMLLKNIFINNSSLLNFIHIVVFYDFVFDVETALENAKLVILERLELQIFFPPPPPSPPPSNHVR